MNSRWISLLGIVVLLGIAWALSERRRQPPWRILAWGVGLQFTFAVLILKTTPGRAVFDAFQNLVVQFGKFAAQGNALVFGPLASESVLAGSFGPANAFILALNILGTIILVSAISSLLYHYGILQRVVQGIAWVMRRTMGTSGSETLAAAANIFMGQTEAPLVIRPYLPRMTRSELFAMMTGGMATVAGSVGVAYVSFGIEAGHLLTASVMSAPASLTIAKLMLPETETSETAGGTRVPLERETLNGLDALCAGASDGMKLSINVIAMLIAFTATIAAFNWILSTLLAKAGVQIESPLQWAMGWINAPFAWLMGVPAEDCRIIGTILGERIVLNEFIGYLDLTQLGDKIQPRSRMIAIYALCGFANVASIAIQIGGIGGLAPVRRVDLARLGLRSMIGGLLACYLTAAIAGLIS